MRLFFTRETLGWYHEVVFHSRDSRGGTMRLFSLARLSGGTMRLFFTRETLGWYHEVVFTRETLGWYHEVVFHSRDSRVVP